MNKLFSITLKHSHQTLFIMVRLLSNTPASAFPRIRYLRPPQLHARRSQVAYKYKIWLTFSGLISASRWIYRLGTQQRELPFQPGFRFSSVLTLTKFKRSTVYKFIHSCLCNFFYFAEGNNQTCSSTVNGSESSLSHIVRVISCRKAAGDFR